MSTAATLERPDLDTIIEAEDEAELPYVIVLWNDSVTPVRVVIFILRRIFSYPLEQAKQIATTAHRENKAIAYHGTKERCEHYCVQLHLAALSATVSKG